MVCNHLINFSKKGIKQKRIGKINLCFPLITLTQFCLFKMMDGKLKRPYLTEWSVRRVANYLG